MEFQSLNTETGGLIQTIFQYQPYRDLIHCICLAFVFPKRVWRSVRTDKDIVIVVTWSYAIVSLLVMFWWTLMNCLS